MVDVYSKYTFKHTSHHSSSNSPSFSSSLLDAVYRSIDNGDEAMRTKQNQSTEIGGANAFKSDEAMANYQRACMIEKWMEKKANEAKKSRKERENTSSNSWDSSYSCENVVESFPIQGIKPVRTSGRSFEMESSNRNHTGFSKKSKQESGFIKTKSRALKLYDEMKKVKQPISPGGKLAGFLNSIFTNGNSKRPKTTSTTSNESLKSGTTTTSTCSSASSFSRSCLSKTPSTGKSSNYAKRTVRFSPVSVILDEHCQPCGHKWLHEETNYNSTNKKENCSIRSIINEELMAHVSMKNRRVEEVAKDLLKSYQNKVHEFVDEDEDYDDAASCASSDLFELDNLSTIGMDKYSDELPVYATTNINY